VKHVADNQVAINGNTIHVGEGEFAGPGRDMSICVKMHDLELLDGDETGGNLLPGVVRSHAFLGSHRDYVVDIGQDLLITAPATLEIAPGSKVKVRFRAERCRALSR
jgi:hypothetical protein